MSRENWMKTLATHYEKVRKQSSPENSKPLLILFDIDGTILDRRYTIKHLLNNFDREHDTNYFDSLSVSDITVHENDLESFLHDMDLGNKIREDVLAYYYDNRWSESTIFESHKPYQGVMDVIRWFQLKHRTHVGLNTARPESRRTQTLKSLNRLGNEFKVQFHDDLLFMNPDDSNKSVRETKVDGIRHFKNNGYTVVAMIDNEPENLEKIAESNCSSNILLLHANTIFQSRQSETSDFAISGSKYGVTDLIQEHDAPEHIRFIWSGVNNSKTLEKFLSSNIHWGEIDLRFNPDSESLVLRSSSYHKKPTQNVPYQLQFRDCFQAFQNNMKGLMINLHLNENRVHILQKSMNSIGYMDGDLGFHVGIDDLQTSAFSELIDSFPSAKIQCSINFLSSVILSDPDKARSLLDIIQSKWMIESFSINWQLYHKKRIIEQLKRWDFSVTVCNIPDLEHFLQAAMLLPDSVTGDFDQKGNNNQSYTPPTSRPSLK